MSESMHYQVTVWVDSFGGYRATIDDWYTRSGHGDTPSEAIIAAVRYADEWINAEPDSSEAASGGETA